MHVTLGLPQMEKVAYDAIYSIASCRTCGKPELSGWWGFKSINIWHKW